MRFLKSLYTAARSVHKCDASIAAYFSRPVYDHRLHGLSAQIHAQGSLPQCHLSASDPSLSAARLDLIGVCAAMSYEAIGILPSMLQMCP